MQQSPYLLRVKERHVDQMCISGGFLNYNLVIGRTILGDFAEIKNDHWVHFTKAIIWPFFPQRVHENERNKK